MRFNDTTREGTLTRFELSTVYSYFADLNADEKLGAVGRALGSRIAQSLGFQDLFIRQPVPETPEVEEAVETTEDDE